MPLPSQCWSEPSYIAQAGLAYVSLLTNPLNASGIGTCCPKSGEVTTLASCPLSAAAEIENGPFTPAHSAFNRRGDVQ